MIICRSGRRAWIAAAMSSAVSFPLCMAPPSNADIITIESSKDNTLIEDATGALSNGIGPLFCGQSGIFAGNKDHRLVIAFDVAAAVPAGSTINSVTLRLTLENANLGSGDQSHTVHRLTRNWGEAGSSGTGGLGGPAEPGDATWLHTFFDAQTWSAAGAAGDFVAGASASQTVGITLATYDWTSAQLAADVQAMLDRPSCNFGWIMLGNESTANTARRFASAESLTPAATPKLIIDYTSPAIACPADINNDTQVNVPDLLMVITNWGACLPCPSSCAADIAPAAADQTVSVPDLLSVITNWGPCD